MTEPVKVIKSLREFKPDLILMDIYMPEVNGIELTTIIRDHKEFVTIPIVFVSGEQNTDKQLDALSVGGDDFIAKPIRPKTSAWDRGNERSVVPASCSTRPASRPNTIA